MTFQPTCKLLLTALFCLPIICFSQKFTISKGTTLLAYVSKDTIWMAADSRVLTINACDKGYDTVVTTRDKIYKYKDINYAFCGHLTFDIDSFDFFNPDELFRKVVNVDDLDATCEQFASVVKGKLSSYFFFLKNTNRRAFDSCLNKSVLGTILATFINHKPYYRMIDFALTGNADSFNIQKREPEYNIPLPVVMLDGYKDHIEQYLKFRPDYFQNRNDSMENKLKGLIELEVNYHPLMVNYPIKSETLINK
jgi:hypothetical protein